MVTLTEEEKKLSYAKYFYQELAKIPEEKLAIAAGPILEPSQILPIEDKNNFLAGKDKGAQIGFGIATNGTGYVANVTFMPGVTVEMMDWWFAWHPITSDLRYKLWDHDDHYYARANKQDYILDKSIPMNQKTWGVDHDIMEDVGMGPSPLRMHFRRPADFGYDENLIGSSNCTSLVCAVGEGDTPAFMTHKFCEALDGMYLMSRFWMGYALIDEKLKKVIPDGVDMPEIAPRVLFSHNIKEFTNLAAILPQLYEEEKDNWTSAR